MDYPTLARQIIDSGGVTSYLDGSQPIRGFAIGTQGHERRYRVSTTKDIEQALSAFVIDNGYDLREWRLSGTDPLRGYAVGAWVQPGGVLVLDLVVVFPPDSREQAIIDGRLNDQEAIYDLGAKQEIALR